MYTTYVGRSFRGWSVLHLINPFLFFSPRRVPRLLHVFREYILNKTINSLCARLQYFVGHDFYRENASIGVLLIIEPRTNLQHCFYGWFVRPCRRRRRTTANCNFYSGEEGDDGGIVYTIGIRHIYTYY